MTRRYVATCDCGWTAQDVRVHRIEAKAAQHRCNGHRRSCRTCGWSVSAISAKKADYAKKQHSCQRHLERTAARQRRETRDANVDRTPQPCHHKQATHVHGTYACYVLDFCRCRPCAAANATYEAERTRLQAYGRWNGYVDAEPAREHVRELMAAGMGLKRIVVISGISQGLLWKLIYGKRRPDGTRTPSKRIRPATAERLLATVVDLADGAKIDGTGTRRRLQALVAYGYSITTLGQRIGVSNIHRTIHGGGDGLVIKATADTVAGLYEQLSMRPASADDHRTKISVSRARRYAAEHDWPPPLAWDDDTIDDPTATAHGSHRTVSLAHDTILDEAAIYRRMHGDKTVRLSKAEAAVLVQRWADTGRPLNECERITGIKADRHLRLRDRLAEPA